MAWNLTTGAVVGTLVGGIAYFLTGRHSSDSSYSGDEGDASDPR